MTTYRVHTVRSTVAKNGDVVESHDEAHAALAWLVNPVRSHQMGGGIVSGTKYKIYVLTPNGDIWHFLGQRNTSFPYKFWEVKQIGIFRAAS